MQPQNFSNHRRFVTGFHFLLSAMLLAGIIVSYINENLSADDIKKAIQNWMADHHRV